MILQVNVHSSLGGGGGGGTFTIQNSTISGNSASSGGGIYRDGGGGTYNLTNTIVAGNAITGGTGTNIFGALSSSISNLVDVAPLLAPLGNYGGPTQTMPPLPGSPAIDAGSDTATNTFATDQRGIGFPRLSGLHVDIGAVEATAVPEIAVEQPAGTDLVDGTASINFAYENVGLPSAAKTFVITNRGIGTLMLTNITQDGPDSGDFAVGALGATILAPEASTTFTVTFTPGDVGARSAALHLANNDSDENPFDIALTGTGVSPVVTTSSDSGPGSLRQVIAEVPAGTTITFAPALSGATILLTSGQLMLDKNLTIDGSALAEGIIINGNANGRIFQVNGSHTVVLDSLTMTNGSVVGSGGGIYNLGSLAVNRCTLVGNSATAYGGAIFSSDSMNLDQCTVAGNFASNGGGVRNELNLTADRCTFSGNSATNNGGAFNNSGQLILNQCTVAGNTATNHGGGIRNAGAGTVSLNNCTVSANTTVTSSGGGGINNGGGDFTIFNSIVAGNDASAGDYAGSVTWSGPNLTFGVPLLAPLGNYGGPTQTMPPLPGSPAINAGFNPANTNLTDQRGFARVGGGALDIGAVELETVQSYGGNKDTGFGGTIGYGSLGLVDDGTNVFGILTSGGGLGGFNDNLVLYLDSVPGGFTNTAGFADNADGLRRAISGFYDGANRSVLTNLPGFLADYAIAMGPASASFGGLWGLADGGANSLNYLTSVNLSPLFHAALTYTFSFPVSAIGLTPGSGATFRLFGTYVSSTGYRSTEALPGNVSGVQGWNPFNNTAVASYTIQRVFLIASTPPVLTGLTKLGNGPFQFGFTNLAGASFTVFGSTNVALPFNLWSNLGAPVEAPPGTFLFTDPQATNHTERFYRVQSP